MRKLSFLDLEAAIEWSYVRSSGPGGQHVNRTNSCVQLKINIMLLNLSDEEIHYIKQKLLNKLVGETFIMIRSESERDQKSNKDACIKKAIALFEQALIKPKVRKKTKPTYSSKIKRLESKSKKSLIKKSRREKIDY